MKCYVWNIALCGDDTLTLLEVRQKYLGGFEMCWADHVGNDEVLHTVKEKMNILHTVKIRVTLLVTFCVRTAF